MADPLPRERLQPCLLDRLTDEEPDAEKESRASRVISLERYRKGVERDLSWLFNASAHLSQESVEEFPLAAASVLNFGMRDFSGRLSSNLNQQEIEHDVTEAIQRFEPRIIAHSLSVKVVTGGPVTNPNVLSFEVRGQLWANPLPEELYIRTEMDIDTCRWVT